MRRSSMLACVTVVVAVISAGPAWGQVIHVPGAIWETATPGAAAARAPGVMVTAGLARAVERAPNPLGHHQITATHTTSPGAQLLADSIETVFDQLNNALIALFNALFARAGGDPFIPTGILGNTSSGSSGGLSGLLDQLPR